MTRYHPQHSGEVEHFNQKNSVYAPYLQRHRKGGLE